MSVAMTSNTDVTLVYVRLMGEGTTVFRPTKAVCLGQAVVRLLASANYDPDDEDWEFKPGSVVRTEQRILDGANANVVVALAEQP